MNAGTTIKLTSDLAITIGKLVTVHPVGAAANLPTSGAIPPADGPTPGVIVSAFLTSFGKAFAKVRLLAPGKANNNRTIIVTAGHVAG